ncbi:hypothetical protein [Cohnella hongkongensis]|uniref:Uncharacterized protein n=1 Tax=Cohnella hongkongensis TaxID=178337 RepID=A0ABV9FKS9_9BACL
MESYDLAELAVSQHAHRWNLVFSRARLMVVSDHGTRLWYVDIDGMADGELLQRFADSDSIEVQMTATTVGGKKLSGSGFFHPNPRRLAAAIRGDGPLIGYGAP